MLTQCKFLVLNISHAKKGPHTEILFVPLTKQSSCCVNIGVKWTGIGAANSFDFPRPNAKSESIVSR